MFSKLQARNLRRVTAAHSRYSFARRATAACPSLGFNFNTGERLPPYDVGYTAVKRMRYAPFVLTSFGF